MKSEKLKSDTYQNAASPIELVTKTSLFDVMIKPNSTIEFEVEEMAFIYLISGEITIQDQVISSPSAVNFEKDGQKVKVITKSQTANFMFTSGTPHNEPIVHGGPFVMTTQEQIIETQQRLRRGEMGILNPL